MNIKELFLKQKEAVRKQTHQVLPLIRLEHLNWRPEKDALSVGEMLRHVWVSEEGVRRAALEGNFAYYETRIPQGLRAVLGRPGLLEEETANLERVHQQTLDLVSAFPLERFEEDRIHEQLGIRLKVYAILFGIVGHEIHPRAVDDLPAHAGHAGAGTIRPPLNRFLVLPFQYQRG
ncbi:MAG: DinB family protein [Chloroflexota bacterium]